jgi:hypothetical protein
MENELLTFIYNVDYIRKITVTFKDMKLKVTHGANNRLFWNLNLNNMYTIAGHTQINAYCLSEK